MIRLISAAMAALFLLAPSTAQARHHHHVQWHEDSRPHAWCGWFGRFNFLGHDPGAAFNLAANWRHIGSPDGSPNNGDIVVWPHHVGKIVGTCTGYRCPVWSGNDGHEVRTRMRSVSRAVFRRV